MSSKNKAVAVVPQLTLWNEIPRVTGNLGTGAVLVTHRNKLQEITGESLRLLPISAGKDKKTNKLKDSLKLRYPKATPKELKEMHKAQAMEMKGFLGNVAIALVQNPDVVGIGPRIGKNGRVSLVFKKDVPQVDMLTDEELASAMGRPVEWVQKNRREVKPTEIELEVAKAAPESQPNGNVIPPVATPAA